MIYFYEANQRFKKREEAKTNKGSFRAAFVKI